jgi:regulator of protease activity HflC (stomatin/prohibitin superfamily)
MNELVQSKIAPLKLLIKKNLLAIAVGGIIFVSSIIVLLPEILHVIPAGYVGVIYNPLANGVNTKYILNEGAHLVMPWSKVTQYSIQTQSQTLNVEVLTLDQLKTKATVMFQFEIDSKTVPYLHKYIGTDYVSKIVVPEVTQITRQVIGKLSSKDAFTSSLTAVAKDIAIDTNERIINSFNPDGLLKLHLLDINSVQISKVEYPEAVAQAIEQKVTEQTKADAMVFVLQAAQKEAERKKIEAGGIKSFQDTIGSGLTENYLRLTGIQATKELANSSNAKIVIFGSGQSGLPLIFDDFKNTNSKNSGAK